VSYCIDAKKICLDELRERIMATDLVPSRAGLLDDIEEKFRLIKLQGIQTFAELRQALKSTTSQEALAKSTNLDSQYLVLLRREIESYIIKPVLLKDFTELSTDALSRLDELHIRNTAVLYEYTCDHAKLLTLAEQSGIDPAILVTLARLVNLTRVQWVNLTVARMLLACGIENPNSLAAVDSQHLYESFDQINAQAQYFKGKIGLRDVKRLIQAARYVDDNG